MLNRGIFGLNSIGALAALGMMGNIGVDLFEPRADEQVKRRSAPRQTPKWMTGFHPTINRWTGRPHEHKQEIARRLRQRGIEMPLPIPEPVKAPRRRKAAAAK